MGVVRILFLADTHLGFDLPVRPRIKRRRRGHDFFKNYEDALKPALNGQVDCVVHGGDIFFRSKVATQIVERAFNPLKKIAGLGIPVYVVPGNHERSTIPHRSYAEHPLIFIYDQPATFVLKTEKGSVALSGFPFIRNSIQTVFKDILVQTGWNEIAADARILCMHQAVEGSRVGVQNYTFRHSRDVIKIKDIPGDFLAVLSGHIHRAQLLRKDLAGRPSAAPIFYPGSIDRTSFAERGESKGYMILEIEIGNSKGSFLKNWRFHELDTRPMIRKEIFINNYSAEELRNRIRNFLYAVPDNSIVDFKITGSIPDDLYPVISAPALREVVPPSMNVTATQVEHRRRIKKPR